MRIKDEFCGYLQVDGDEYACITRTFMRRLRRKGRTMPQNRERERSRHAVPWEPL